MSNLFYDQRHLLASSQQEYVLPSMSEQKSCVSLANKQSSCITTQFYNLFIDGVAYQKKPYVVNFITRVTTHFLILLFHICYTQARHSCRGMIIVFLLQINIDSNQNAFTSKTIFQQSRQSASYLKLNALVAWRASIRQILRCKRLRVTLTHIMLLRAMPHERLCCDDGRSGDASQ